MTTKAILCLAGCLIGIATSARASEPVVAAPYKLMRSLQILQDKVAFGDKAAYGMQSELAKIVDMGFRKLDRSVQMDERDARALISYAMAGGNPRTLEELLPNVGDRDDELVRLAIAILMFQKGASNTAAVKLQNADPRGVGGLFGAALALVRGLVTKDDEEALVDFDTARLLAPGTLIEEAALRRLMTIHKRRQDPVSFLRISSRYARRYIASPYAMQFAQEFVAGVVAMDGWMDMDPLLEVVEFMPGPYRDAVMIRLMRAATVEGKIDLVRRLDTITSGAPEEISASSDDAEMEVLQVDETDVRRRLYSRISEITSENVREVTEELRSMEDSALSEGDRELLNAVLAVAERVASPEPVDPIRLGVRRATAPVGPDGEPLESGIFDAPRADAGPLMDDFDNFVTGAREALEGIDNVLEGVE
jgi:chemotaxis protein MotC